MLSEENRYKTNYLWIRYVSVCY